jgi:uncharacterized membrane protein
MRPPRRFVHNRKGGVATIVALMMPVIVGMAAFAVDIGAAQLETRKLQGIADAAAIAAAADPAHAAAAAQASVTAAGWPRQVEVAAITGRYDRTLAPGRRFSADTTSTAAVRVTLSAQSPTFFAHILGYDGVPIRRSATAAQTNIAALSIGSRLAALQGGVVNSFLSALTGSSVSLSVMDYNSLAGAQIDLLNFLDALHTTANLSAGTYDDTLDAQVTTPQLLNALADSLPAGNAAQAAAIRGIALHAGATKVSLSSLIDLGPLGQQGSGGKGMTSVDALTMLSTLAQIGNGQRQVQLDLSASVLGLAQTKIWLAIGQRPAQSPWITVTASGAPIIRTAQTRLYVETSTANLSLPGLGTLAQVKLPLFVELASAEAKLKQIECGASRAATIDARPSPGQAAIAAIDTSKLNDFATPLAQSPARVLDTLLIDVDAQATINLGQAETWQPLRFDQNAIDAGEIKTVSSGTLTQSIAASLVSRLQLTPRIIGLPIPLAPLTQAVGQQLAVLAPVLDTLLDTTTGTLGVHFGQADVKVTGLRCGTPSLVG